MAITECSPKTVRLASMLLYCISGVIEFVGIISLIVYIPATCVTARENSTRVWWALNCMFPQIIPDFVFAVLGFFFVTHFYAPLGGAYNISTAILCIVSAIFAFIANTGCGNPAEPLTIVAGVFELIAGGLHIAILGLVAINVEGDDKLFKRSSIKDN